MPRSNFGRASDLKLFHTFLINLRTIVRIRIDTIWINIGKDDKKLIVCPWHVWKSQAVRRERGSGRARADAVDLGLADGDGDLLGDQFKRRLVAKGRQVGQNHAGD